jgi:hypothetical protein
MDAKFKETSKKEGAVAVKACDVCISMVSVVQAGLSQEARERVAAEAADRDQWDLVVSTVETGVSVKMRDELTKAAAACGQWTCVVKLARLGISPQQRDSLFITAVRHRHVACCVLLHKLGLNSVARESAVRKAIEKGRAVFLADVLKQCEDPAFTSLTVWLL